MRELLLDAHEARASRAASRVVLVGGNFHPHFWGVRAAKSFSYTHCLGSTLGAAGYPTVLYTDKELSADDAFCFMASARTFVQGGGGFSRLAAQLARAASDGPARRRGDLVEGRRVRAVGRFRLWRSLQCDLCTFLMVSPRMHHFRRLAQ